MQDNSLFKHAIGPVGSRDDLLSEIENLRKKYANSQLLFRGQDKLFPKVRSGRARPNVEINKEVEHSWKTLGTKLLGLENLDKSSPNLVPAILQHYGVPTFFVDLTVDIDVASWFATYSIKKSTVLFGGAAGMRPFSLIEYQRQKSGFGYIVILAAPKADILQANGTLIDISTLPETFARPRRQSAWLMYDRPPIEPTPNSYWVANIKIDCKRFTASSSQPELFPGPQEDLVYRVLLSLPFIPVPYGYFKESIDPSNEDFISQRVLFIDEYSHAVADHKRKDRMLYEPHPTRMWRGWRFELGDHYEGLLGNFQDTTKLTISSKARKTMYRSVGKVDLFWPELGSDGLFFSFANEILPTMDFPEGQFYGVWLQRQDDLIIEHPTVVDEDVQGICPGHVYRFQEGLLKRVSFKGSCRCHRPEDHDYRVRAMLGLSALISDKRLFCMQHPKIPGWYVVIDSESIVCKDDILTQMLKNQGHKKSVQKIRVAH